MINKNTDLSMHSFAIRFAEKKEIKFRLYLDKAPFTCDAFWKALPFELKILHAKISGQEIWSPDAPKLNIIQENATIFADAGEVVIAPILPERNKITGCIGIFYGEGKLLDCANVFAKVYEEDLNALKKTGEEIWLNGSRDAQFIIF